MSSGTLIAGKVALLCLVALVLQLTVFVDVRVAGVAPELPALIAVLAGLAAGSDRGSLIAFCVGLIWDVYLPTPLGLAAISFALAAYTVGVIESGLFHDTRIQAVVMVFFATAGAVTLYAVLGEILGQGGLVDDELVGIVLIASLINAALAPLVSPLMRWAVGPGIRVT